MSCMNDNSLRHPNVVIYCLSIVMLLQFQTTCYSIDDLNSPGGERNMEVTSPPVKRNPLTTNLAPAAVMKVTQMKM